MLLPVADVEVVDLPMYGVLPGKPQAVLQAVSSAQWKSRRLIAYITGSAIAILDSPDHLVQTIYHDETEIFDAVAFDEGTGKIAVSTGPKVYIYQPFGEDAAALKWSQQSSIDCDVEPGCPCILSWGPEEEILVGSSALMLHQLALGDTLVWRGELSSPAIRAQLSPGAEYIASVGKYDRIVKIWRRLSFGSQNEEFDFSYLAHPSTVTGLEWRNKRDGHDGAEHVLYTICSDGKVRIWIMSNPHTAPGSPLWAEIDLQQSIQPSYLHGEAIPARRLVFFIDGFVFHEAVRAACGEARDDPYSEHLLLETDNEPDVCVIIDDAGHMCAWGLRDVGKRPRNISDVFNIALAEELLPKKLGRFLQDSGTVDILNFRGKNPSNISVLIHSLDDDIVWLDGNIAEVFNPSPAQGRLHWKASWTGHNASIKKINRTRRGGAVVSRTAANQSILWKQASQREGGGLIRSSAIDSPVHIHRSCVLAGGNFVVHLHHDGISLWDTQRPEATDVSSCSFQLEGKPLCLLLLPPAGDRSPRRFVATISSEMRGIVWQIDLPALNQQNGTKHASPSIREFTRFYLGHRSDLAFVVPIDPAGSSPVATGFLDTFAKDVALSYNYDGTLQMWTAQINMEERAIQWLCTATVPTGIRQPSLASGTSIRKVALVSFSRNGLTIWSTRNAELEYEKEFSAVDVIQDLDWTSTPDDQSILAVGFPHKILIMAQIRYDYLDRGPAWAAIREVSIRDFTPHTIGDSTWLGEGNLVIGAGNQLFMYDRTASISDGLTPALSTSVHQDKAVDLFDIISVLNGPLPLFHPQLLSQLILAGKMPQAQKILLKLNQTLKFYTEGDPLESWLSMDPDDFVLSDNELAATQPKLSASVLSESSGASDADSVTEDVALELNENLLRKPLPFLSRHEQLGLANLVECVANAEKHRRSMDPNAVIFTLFFRMYALREPQLHAANPGLSWREIVWAFHSNSQDILLDHVARNYQNRMCWEQACDCGLFMWISDVNVLRQQLEVIARNEYTKTYEKNPIDCSLYYIALRKKNVLLGLWRMASWHREQPSTQRLLSNNFSESRWITAALKNAYALLSKRRFEYAAMWFLLAGHLRDAVNVCAQQLNDIQLAIAIARAYEGDGGPVLTELLEERVLPLAAFEGDRWMATWAFWMLGQRDMAVRALITPVHVLLAEHRPGSSGSSVSPSQHARSYLATDPALVVMYRQLRGRTAQTIMGATRVSPREEWAFVLHMARLYDRMGCDVLALDLVRNWEFLRQPPPAKKRPSEVLDPRSLLRRRSSLVVSDVPISPTAVKTPLKSPPPPQVFEEPEANSLLDAFGF